MVLLQVFDLLFRQFRQEYDIFNRHVDFESINVSLNTLEKVGDEIKNERNINVYITKDQSNVYNFHM
jgi:hypothetical protein